MNFIQKIGVIKENEVIDHKIFVMAVGIDS